ITAQPASKAVAAGQTAAFSVTATGTTPISYQWRKNGTNITGATAATYMIPVTVFGDNGSVYSVAISNAFGAVTSANATLTVAALPVITMQPARQMVIVGQAAVFSVTANGTAPISYQWRKNGMDIAGATAADYTTPALVAGDNGAIYSVVVTNAVGSATSASATLTVWSAKESAGVGVPGSTSYADGQYTIDASGIGIGGTSDSFYFAYQSLTGDGQVIARVASLQNTSAGTKAGVMMRTSLADNAPSMFAGLTPSIAMFASRIATNGATTANSGTAASAPYWVKLARYGNSVSGFGSVDGTNWVFIGTEIFPNLPGTLYVGLAVTSGNNSMLATAAFDNVAIGASPADVMPTATLSSPQVGMTNTAPASVTLEATATADTARGGRIIRVAFYYQTMALIGLDQSEPFTIEHNYVPAGNNIYRVRVTDDLGATVESVPITVTVGVDYGGALPAGWTYQDIGAAPTAGQAGYSESDGRYTISSSGYAVAGTNDRVGFAWTTWSGDGQIVARVTSRQGSGLAGVMIRDGLASNARHALMCLHSSCAYCYRRLETGGATTAYGGTTTTAPHWVKLVRSGNSVSAFRSADGANWVFQGTVVMDLPETVNIGLVLTGGNPPSTATFDQVSIGAIPAGDLPTVSIGSPQAGFTNTAPASVTLNAAAADSDGVVLQVAFYQDGALAATDKVAPYSAVLNNVGVGAHVYVARVTDNQGVTVASAPLTIQVVALNITAQPANQTVMTGQTATFSVTVSGTAPLSYQWRRNGENIAGATAASYTTPALVAGDNGAVYSVVVTNAFGAVTSTSATLSVWGASESASAGIQGAASYQDGQYSISASGFGIGGFSDSFYFAWQTLTGDGQIVARVTSLQSINTYTRAGVMLRTGLADNAPSMFAGLTPSVAMFSRRIAVNACATSD
ncbi:MAG: Ig-like domain-containing protein, partial [Kiritimatiellia bacterium]